MAGDIFTQKGEELVADYVDGTASAPANWYIHWGTGSTDPVKGNTALETAATEARQAATESQPTADANRFVATMTCNSTGKTITEAGVFDALTSGNMLLRSTFTGVPVVENDTIEFTFTITWS